MRGHVDSLNVTVAAGIVLFEAVRQRSGAAGRAVRRLSAGRERDGRLLAWHRMCYT